MIKEQEVTDKDWTQIMRRMEAYFELIEFVSSARSIDLGSIAKLRQDAINLFQKYQPLNHPFKTRKRPFP